MLCYSVTTPDIHIMYITEYRGLLAQITDNRSSAIVYNSLAEILSIHGEFCRLIQLVGALIPDLMVSVQLGVVFTKAPGQGLKQLMLCYM